MGLTQIAFLVLLALVGILRLVELRISRRNQRGLIARGAVRPYDASFRWMVVLHPALLVSAALEVILLHRPFLPVLAVAMGILFLSANALRWWVIRTLAGYWSVEVIGGSGLGVADDGPYRWIRHPNYLAVFIEMLALPLIHTAWLTALFGTAAHLAVLRRRVRVEDLVLLADPEYRLRMGDKPRFIPRLFSCASVGRQSALR